MVLIGLAVIFSYSMGDVSAASGDTIYVNGNSTLGNDDWNGESATYQSGIIGPKYSIKNATGTVNTNGQIYIAHEQYQGINNTQITIDRNMTINGESQTDTIINGTGTNWIFHINPGIYVTINNLTLTNATTTYYGGAIYNEGILTVNNSTFTSNTADYGGGAIYNVGTLIVNDSTFTSNTASYFGAIYNSGTVIVNDSTFTSNTANFGGAIANDGTLTVNDSTFTSNTANYGGGAIYNEGILTVNNSTFTSNSAHSYGGGAIRNANYAGTLNVSFCRIVGNTPYDIYSDGAGGVDYNWWGSNFVGSDPVTAGRVAGGATVSKWLVLTTTADPNTINTGETSNITADLLHDQDGVYQDPVDGHVPDGIVVNFLSDALGTVNPLTGTMINGEASTLFTAGPNPGISTITTWVDQQTMTTTVAINTIPTTIPTTIIVAPVSGLNGKTVNLIATLTDSDSNPVSGASVQFNVNGTIIGSVNTDTNGIATLSYTITQTSGTYTILANYFGNNTYAASSNTNKLDVNFTPTNVIVNALTGNKGETVNLTATLTDTEHQLAISGETIKFLINGNLVGSAVTNSNGIATLPYTITQNGGYYYIDAVFAGDNIYNSSTGNATLKVPQSNIYILVTSSNSHPKIGETVKITFKVGNKGPDTANNVVLTLKIPEGMEYVSATADTGSFTYNPTTRTITWNISNLPVGDPKLILNTKVLQPGNYTIKPTITTETYDPNIPDNTGLININVTNNTTNSTEPVVNAETIPMQPTGTPIIPLILGALMMVLGITRRN